MRYICIPFVLYSLIVKFLDPPPQFLDVGHPHSSKRCGYIQNVNKIQKLTIDDELMEFDNLLCAGL